MILGSRRRARMDERKLTPVIKNCLAAARRVELVEMAKLCNKNLILMSIDGRFSFWIFSFFVQTSPVTTHIKLSTRRTYSYEYVNTYESRVGVAAVAGNALRRGAGALIAEAEADEHRKRKRQRFV